MANYQEHAELLSKDAALNTLLYLITDYDSGVSNGQSVNSIVEEIRVRVSDNDDLRKLKCVENAINNDPSIGKLIIGNNTNSMIDPKTGLGYEKGGISACTFQNSQHNPSEVYFVFRGTSGGEWYDNGIGLSGEVTDTDQQIQAREYFDTIIGLNEWYENKPFIHITGHSKGGNKTQYVVLTSEYSHLITSGFSLDGQCMSKEMIDYWTKTLGEEEFERRRQKLYSFSADNDYVNVLGVNEREGRVILDDHVFFLDSNLDGVKWHYPDCFMNVEGPSITTIHGQEGQGVFSKYIQSISKPLMELPAPIRSIITNGAMGIAEIILGNGVPVNGESLSYAEILASIPTLLEMLPVGIVGLLGETFNVDVDWLSNAMASSFLVLFAPLNAAMHAIGNIIDIELFVCKKMLELGKQCVDLTNKFILFIKDSFTLFQEWVCNNFTPGYSYAQNNPYIAVDTSALWSYSDRLTGINRRISNLDSRLDSLYWKVGFFDLWDIIKADALTGYSFRISQCANYLSTTADNFDSVEKEIYAAI